MLMHVFVLPWPLQQTVSPAVKSEGWQKGSEAGKCHTPLIIAPQIKHHSLSLSTQHVCPIHPCHPTPLHSTYPPTNAGKGPEGEALPAGQTPRPVEHKGWVNSSLAFFSRPTLPAEAETNAGRIHGLCYATINSSNHQGNNAHSCVAWHVGMYHQIVRMS